jgi:dTDP-4-dehydrorhamnose 3,5-epimerase
MIEGVTIKNIKKHKDKEGFFAELIKFGEPTFHKVLQTSYSETKPGIIKAWHIHDYWEALCIIKGEAKVVLHDMRPGSLTLGKTQVVYANDKDMRLIAIPGEVAHGYKPLGKQTVGVVYHAAEAYDPGNITIRTIPHDDPTIGFDWSKS